MEQFVEKTYDIFLDLLAKKQEEPIKISLLKDEISRIEKFDPDIVEMFESGEAGELTIAPEQLKDGDDYCDYKFYIEPGSTYKREEAIENQSLVDMLQLVMSLPHAAEQIAQNGSVQIGDHVIDIAKMVKRRMVVKGIQDWDNIIKPVEEASLEGNAEDPELMQLMEQIQAGIPRSEPPIGPEMEQGAMPPMI
jgi:transcription-repair coupling factor (superfamily II helicase)